MVLDIVKCGAKAVAGKCLREELGKLPPLATVPQTRQHQVHIGRMAENIADSPHTMRVTVQIERDMVHVAEAHAGIAQAKGNRLRGKSCPMLDPAKPLFFGRRHQHAVAYEGS